MDTLPPTRSQRSETTAHQGERGTDTALNALAEYLFSSLSRSDQRRKGRQYLRGLLLTPGRKSIRNMATLIGGTGTGQSLHHFISSSTWDWTPVRRALAEFTAREAPPQAWVLRPLLIPKTGTRSVGIAPYPHGPQGHPVLSQQAVGVWLASEQAAVPVHWHLHLPDGEGGCGGEGPADAATAECATDACLELLAEWRLPARPVVFDLEGPRSFASLRRLRAAGLTPVARVTQDLELTVADPALLGHTGTVLPAGAILQAARALRHPVPRRGEAASQRRAPRPSGPGRPRSADRRGDHPPELAAAVRVTLPAEDGGPARTPAAPEFALVGVGPSEHAWPRELWLTALRPHTGPPAVSRFSRLLRMADVQKRTTGDRVGLRDYAGRSFSGWHRHVTLASAAHALAQLSPGADAAVAHAPAR